MGLQPRSSFLFLRPGWLVLKGSGGVSLKDGLVFHRARTRTRLLSHNTSLLAPSFLHSFTPSLLHAHTHSFFLAHTNMPMTTGCRAWQARVSRFPAVFDVCTHVCWQWDSGHCLWLGRAGGKKTVVCRKEPRVFCAACMHAYVPAVHLTHTHTRN